MSQINAVETTNYAYDNANRISGITNTTNSALSWTYGYDLLDRLTSAGVSGTSFGWTYDANGNRLTQTGTDEWTLNVRSTNNQITSTTGTQARTYTYDAAGNSLTYQTNTFTYSDSDRLKTLKVGSSTTTYVINALGQRVKKSGGSAGTVLYMYDETGHTLGEYTSTGALTEETIWLGDIPVATIVPSGSTVAVYYLMTDHLNTPKKIGQPSSNKLAWRWDNDPFGIFTPNQNPQSLGTFVYNLRLPGQMYDSEAGLNYNYARDFDPQVGRYVEPDPIGLDGGINVYSYAVANPISFSDRSGLIDPYKHLPRPIQPPSNGNVFPGFNTQDGVCTLPGRIGRAANGNLCILGCCKAHDDCYTKNGCNMSSWLGNAVGWPFPNKQCQKCNSNVVDCVIDNAGRDGSAPCKSCQASK